MLCQDVPEGVTRESTGRDANQQHRQADSATDNGSSIGGRKWTDSDDRVGERARVQ